MGKTAQKMMFSIKDFFSKCDQIRSFMRIRSHLLKKSLMENFIFCAVANAYVILFIFLITFWCFRCLHGLTPIALVASKFKLSKVKFLRLKLTQVPF